MHSNELGQAGTIQASMNPNTLRAIRHIRHIGAASVIAAVVAAVVTIGTAGPALSAPTGTTTLVYDFSRSGMSIAEMTDTLEVRGRDYHLSSVAQGVGIVALLARGQTIKRDSRGTIGAKGLQPKTFTEERGSNYKLTAEFNWPSRQVALTDAKGERSEEPLTEGTQDRMSMPYQVAFVHGAPPAEWSIQVTDGKRLTAYAFRLVGTENVTTGLGEIKALHYTKVVSGNDSAFDLWLGVDQQLLPVRVSYADKDGARYEQSLRSLRTAGH